jgi:hypothetical protein
MDTGEADAAAMGTLIVQATVDTMRAMRGDEEPEIAAIVLQILESADSPENAVESCIRVFSLVIDQVLEQVGRDADRILQAALNAGMAADGTSGLER